MPYNYPQNPLKQYLSPYSLPTTSKEHELVGGDYGLREFITDTLSVGDFQRGHTYYEFTNEMENIHEGKEVLLQSKENSKKWFQLALPEQVAAGGLKLYGEGIARSNFGDRYRVFIQSFGSGARLLPDGSSILYNHSDNQVIFTFISINYFDQCDITTGSARCPSTGACLLTPFCSQSY